MFSKSQIEKLIKDRLPQDLNTHDFGYINDLDFPDIFKEPYEGALGGLGPEAFYHNPYVRNNFWSIVSEGYTYVVDAVSNVALAEHITCAIELPLEPRIDEKRYLFEFSESDLDRLDRFFTWPRFCFYKLGAKKDESAPLLDYPVKLPDKGFLSQFRARNILFKPNNSASDISTLTEILSENNISDYRKICEIKLEFGYYSTLKLFPL